MPLDITPRPFIKESFEQLQEEEGLYEQIGGFSVSPRGLTRYADPKHFFTLQAVPEVKIGVYDWEENTEFEINLNEVVGKIGGEERFKFILSGVDKGDFIVGNLSGNYLKWDESENTLEVKGKGLSVIGEAGRIYLWGTGTPGLGDIPFTFRIKTELGENDLIQMGIVSNFWWTGDVDYSPCIVFREPPYSSNSGEIYFAIKGTPDPTIYSEYGLILEANEGKIQFYADNYDIEFYWAPKVKFKLNDADGYCAITQYQVGGGYTMELCTQDGSGNLATRILMRGGGDNANIEFYRGKRGSESMAIKFSMDTSDPEIQGWKGQKIVFKSSGGIKWKLGAIDTYEWKDEQGNTRVVMERDGHFRPASNGGANLGFSNKKWNYLYRNNAVSCDLIASSRPLNPSALEALEKIKDPEWRDEKHSEAHSGQGLYFDRNKVPVDLLVVDDQGEIHIELTRTLGFCLQALREMWKEVKGLKKRIEKLWEKK